jgi:hypothetical protein
LLVCCSIIEPLWPALQQHGDFYPAGPFSKVHIRDVYAQKDLGVFSGELFLVVPNAHASLLLAFAYTRLQRHASLVFAWLDAGRAALVVAAGPTWTYFVGPEDAAIFKLTPLE